MLKKSLLSGFLCIVLMALLVPQASAGCCCNPRFCAKWLKGDVQCNLSVLDNIYGASAVCRVYGTGVNGELTGTAFCVPEPQNGDMAQFARNVEECRLRGNGHIIQKGKGHAKHGDCVTVQNVVTQNWFYSAVYGEFEDCNAECRASLVVETRPEDDPCPIGYILVDFVPDAFYGQAEWDDGGYGGYGGIITELCTATGGLYYNCTPADLPGE
jgi:hypothetical protein